MITQGVFTRSNDSSVSLGKHGTGKAVASSMHCNVCLQVLMQRGISENQETDHNQLAGQSLKMLAASKNPASSFYVCVDAKANQREPPLVSNFFIRVIYQSKSFSETY